MHSVTPDRGRVLVLGRRSVLLTESLELVLHNAGIRASVVDRADAVRGLDDVTALLVCDDVGAQLLAGVLFMVPDPHRVLVVALDDAVVARADVRLPLTADREDLLRAVGAGGPPVVATLGRRLERLSSRRQLRGVDGTAQLTSRESEVVALLVQGTPSRAIAAKLGISVNTVRTHVQNIMAKLGVHSRLEAAGVAAGHLQQMAVSAGAEL